MSGLSNPSQWLVDFLNRVNEGDAAVTPDTVLSLPPVFYAVSRICGHVGQLPCDLKKQLDRGAETAWQDPLWSLLRKKPNSYQIPSVFKEQLTLDVLVNGGGRAYIHRAGGRVLGLYPMSRASDSMFLEGEKFHSTIIDKHDPLKQLIDTDANGVAIVHDMDVVHIPNLAPNGIHGIKLWQFAKRSLGSAISADNRVFNQMKKGFVVDILLEAPPGMFRDEEKAKQFVDGFRKAHSADEEGERVGLLREGMKANVTSSNNQHAQFIEQRTFARQEVALLFLLEAILGDDTSQSYNTLEQKHLAYLSNCLARWLRRFEEELDAKLLGQPKYRDHYYKFNTRALLRTDFQSTITAMSTAITARILSPNECREMLDMNPYDGGDKYENPAITPGNTDKQAKTGQKDAMQARLAHLLGVEAKRLQNATKSNNFCSWVEAFYERWESTLSQAVDQLGGDSAYINTYCSSRVKELLEIAGENTIEKLPKAIEDYVSTFQDRATTLANEVIHVFV